MSVRRSASWAFIGQILSFVVAFAGSVTIAHLLAARELGIYAIAVAAQAIIQTFLNFGVATYVVRDQDLTADKLATAFTINAIVAGLISVAVFMLSFVAKPALGDADAAQVMRLTAILPLLTILSFRASAMLLREMNFKFTSIIDFANVLVTNVATIVLAYEGFSYMSPAYAAIIAAALTTVAYCIAGRRHLGFRLRLVDWRPVIAFGIQMVTVSGVASISFKLCDIILGRVLGVTALGLFSRASTLSNLIFLQIYGTATRVVFVKMCDDVRLTGDVKTTFLRSFQLITGFMWPLLAGLAILARPAISLVYGQKWLPSAFPLSILLVAQIVVLCFGMNWELFVIRNETAKQAKYELTRSIFGVGVFSLGCLLGLAGAALGRVVEAIVGLALYYPHMRRLAGTGPGEIARVYRNGALLMTAAAVPPLVLMLWVHWSASPPILYLIGAVALGIISWLLMIWRIDHPLKEELVLLTRRYGLRPGLFGFGAS